ncbi:MAG: FAD-dependent oxidoreductase, partial [candidate division WOR-3 bacterium]
MAKIGKKEKNYLKEKFVERVCFDKVERKLYGHDIAAIPSLIKPFIGKTIPDAVFQPENEEEIVEIIKWAYKKSIPVIPRGKATSGYGGVIPIKGGIVIDFWRMRRVIQIDEKNMTVTVQPGITWEELDRELKKRGLTLRLYPTSYPSSTVGGWLAQGGAGIGSYEYGYFSQNVISAK